MKKAIGILGALALMLSAFAVQPLAVSAQTPANEVAAICRQLDAEGVLAAAGVTRGECVNILKGPSSANANNFIAGLCGLDEVLEFTGTTNKGQCIQVLGELFEEN
jgi:hypothetical protein